MAAINPIPKDGEMSNFPGCNSTESERQVMDKDNEDRMELESINSLNDNGTDEEDGNDDKDTSDISLHQAARDGNKEQMIALIKRLSNKEGAINQRDEELMTPLHYAARYNRFDIVELLVSEGADINAKGEDKATPLHLSARSKKTKSTGQESETSDQQIFENDTIKYLISNVNVNVNARDTYGSTPLHYAAMRGNHKAIEALLESNNIDVKAADKQEINALHLACSHGSTKCVNLLIDRMEDSMLCTSEENRTPFHFACMEEQLEVCELLLKRARGDIKKKMVTYKDIEGNTALHLAVKYGFNEIVMLCLRNGSYVNALDKNSRTPLHLAAALGDTKIVEILCEHNALIDTLDKSQASPLHRACMYNRKEVAEYLLDKGAKIEQRDQDNFTPLLFAACYGHSEIINLLMKHHADISAADKNEKTAIYWAAEENRHAALKVLRKHSKEKKIFMLQESDKYDNTPLHVAAQKGYLDIVEILLKAKAKIDPINEEEQTPLHLAAKSGKTRTVMELVKRDETIINDKDDMSNTPLHLAASEGHVETLQALLDVGADVQARNSKSWTPLDCAAAEGWLKTSLALLEADSPVDPTDKKQTTPLHLACQNGHVEVVKLLLKWNADLSLCNDKDKNCLDIAIDNSKTDVAMAIINHKNWKKAMENATINHKTGYYDTPMRKLIRKMPDVAHKVLQRCTNLSEETEDNILLEYEFMDDMFTDWRHHNSKKSKAKGKEKRTNSASQNGKERDKHPPEIKHARPTKADDVFEEDGRLKAKAEPYSHDAVVLKENHPLMIMVRSKRVELLGHTLCNSLIQRKWKKCGRWVYYISLAIYCVFLTALTGYILLMPPPYYYYEHPNGTKVWYLDGEDKFKISDPNNLTLSPVVEIFKWIVIVLGVVNMGKEVFEMITKRLDYISLENLIEWTIYILALLVVVDFSSEQRRENWREPWQWKCAAICIFLAWMNLIIFIRKLPLVGIYVVMFIDVLYTFVKFFIVLFLFVIAFGLAFYVLLMNQDPFHTPYFTFVKTFVMMIGELEYDNIFFGDDYLRGETPDITSDEYFTQTVWYSEVTYFLFILFLVIMTIIIMNLLIGLAVDDIKEVQEQAVLKRYAMQVEMALDVEFSIPMYLKRRYEYYVRKETIKQDDKLQELLLNSRAGTSAIASPSVAKGLRIYQEPQDDSLTNTVNSLQQKIGNVESMLQAIMRNQNIEYEEEKKDDVDVGK